MELREPRPRSDESSVRYASNELGDKVVEISRSISCISSIDIEERRPLVVDGLNDQGTIEVTVSDFT